MPKPKGSEVPVSHVAGALGLVSHATNALGTAGIQGDSGSNLEVAYLLEDYSVAPQPTAQQTEGKRTPHNTPKTLTPSPELPQSGAARRETSSPIPNGGFSWIGAARGTTKVVRLGQNDHGSAASQEALGAETRRSPSFNASPIPASPNAVQGMSPKAVAPATRIPSSEAAASSPRGLTLAEVSTDTVPKQGGSETADEQATTTPVATAQPYSFFSCCPCPKPRVTRVAPAPLPTAEEEMPPTAGMSK